MRSEGIKPYMETKQSSERVCATPIFLLAFLDNIHAAVYSMFWSKVRISDLSPLICKLGKATAALIALAINSLHHVWLSKQSWSHLTGKVEICFGRWLVTGQGTEMLMVSKCLLEL